ncbi:unnamed protein product [Prorocentrum cordatum]|uniref:Uncharacterized protein n=1 Tax=Prorocentrum cordatum TaxID=2364126 RepID=A0ABN9V5H4_9DINO|nr:unnamed protein product [Polarella glacialis]
MAAMAGRAAPPAVGRARQEGALPRAPRTFSASLPIRQLRAPGAGAAEGSAGLPARAGAAAGAGALAALVSRTRGRRPRRRPARRPGAALLQGWRSRSAAPACSSGHDLDTLAEWHSATSIRRAWRAERRASILASVRAGWADSVTCAAANKGPRAECMTPTNLTLVGSPPLLWVAFYDTDVEQDCLTKSTASSHNGPPSAPARGDHPPHVQGGRSLIGEELTQHGRGTGQPLAAP